ncbi:MAG: tetratricopeptide repeat protein [Acidobacteria bacterium]|nr:MAG: tetratricopeptide repeat protein [Acidobacteriota bacterium]
MRIVLSIVLASSVAISLSAQQGAPRPKVPPMSPADGIEFGDDMLTKGRYPEAIVAYQRARLASTDEYQRVRAGAGEVKGILRMAGFGAAVDEAASLVESAPRNPRAIAVLGDALWAAGRFTEAEAAYDKAIAIDPADSRARHGRGRALAARGRLAEGLADVEAAVSVDPREEAYLYSMSEILEQLRRFPEAAAALDQYREVMPDKKQNNSARWATAQAALLRGFGKMKPFEIESPGETFTIPFKVVNDKVLVSARINGGQPIDVVVDTGAEHTSLTPDVARAARVDALSVVPTAGIGERGVGFRDLQMGRIDRLEIGPLKARNVTCFIKSPSLTNVPITETQGFAPLALGMSVSIDYSTRVMTLARQIPKEDAGIRLPLRMQRLAMVRGTVNGAVPATFIIDTGGELGLVVSGRLADSLNMDPAVRRIPINVYGTAGRDRSATILPYVDVAFGLGVEAKKASVAVLNLDAPSFLLGIDIGGIVGHGFLSKYKVTFDLQHGELALR